MKELELHALAGLGTIVSVALLVVPVTLLRGPAAKAGPNLAQMEAIEADLAMKSEDAPKVPQKPTRAPDPKVDEAVGGDPNAKAETCKKDADCTGGKICRNDLCVKKDSKHPDDQPPPDLSQFHHATDDDNEVGATKEYKPGAFDGDEFGWAPTTKGDKFYIELIKDLREGWEYPEILSDAGVPVGCLHLEMDGKISDTLMHENSGNSELDDSVERALTTLQKRRNQDPVEVPTHLLQDGVTEKWLCIRFKPKAS